MKILYLSYDWRNMSQKDQKETLRRLRRDGLEPETNEITMLQIGSASYEGVIGKNIQIRIIGASLRHLRPITDFMLGSAALGLYRKGYFDAVVAAEPSVLWWLLFTKRKGAVMLFINTLYRTLARRTGRWYRYWYSILSEQLVRGHITHFLAISQEGMSYAARYLKAPKERTRLFLPNTFDELTAVSSQEDIRTRYSISKEALVILSVSRLESEKGVDRLIELMKYTPEETRCLVVGDGSQRSKLEERCRSLGISEKVLFVGQVPHIKLSSYYGTADALAQFSRSESLGLSVLEAMHFGVPVIVSPVGGLLESVGSSNERGFLVETKEQWKNAIEIIGRKDPDLEKVKIEAREYVAGRLSTSKTLKELI